MKIPNPQDYRIETIKVSELTPFDIIEGRNHDYVYRGRNLIGNKYQFYCIPLGELDTAEYRWTKPLWRATDLVRIYRPLHKD